jgi:hypothetical protein
MSTKSKVIELIQRLPDDVRVEQIIAEIRDHEGPAPTSGRQLSGLAEFAGMWADRDDGADGCEVVRKEREQWQQRLTRRD